MSSDGAAAGERDAFLRTSALLLLVALLVGIGSRPPLPAGADAAADRFSAGRAMELLRRLLADGAPHPVGSEANDALRRRLEGELRALGLEPELQESLSCSPWGQCARVKNVLAVLPGRRPDGMVMAACHYDSVGAGPGAADDGAAVASLLEIGRIAAAWPERERGLVLFFGDGEEAGLLGARAFVASHPLARRVDVVVNLEARGTAGPSALFETSSGNLGLVRLAARPIPRPLTSSLLYHLYELLPNDTDLTVFKAAGMRGLNFAFADGVDRYHTPRDDVAHLDPASVQHQGDGALAAIQALVARAPDAELDPTPALFQDFLGLFVVSFPASWAMPLAVLAAATIFGGAAAIGRMRPIPLDEALLGLAVWTLVVVAPPLAGQLALTLVELAAGVPRPWAAHPLPFQLMVAGAATAAGLGALRLASASAGPRATTVAGAAVLAGLALVASWVIPGAALLALAPALGAASAILACLLHTGRTSRLLAIVWPIATAMVCWPLARALLVMVGLDLSLSITLPLALVLGALAPVAAGIPRGAPRLLVAASAAAALWALLSPPRDAAAPDPLAIVARQLDGQCHLLLRTRHGGRPWRLPESPAARFGPLGFGPFPWSSSSSSTLGAALAPLGLAEPRVDVAEDRDGAGNRRLRIRVDTGAPGSDLIFGIHDPGEDAAELAAGARTDQLVSLEVEGTVLPDGWRESSRRGAWNVVRLHGAGSGEIGVTTSGAASVEVVVASQSRGLPSALDVRRPAGSVSFQDGDLTIVARTLRL